MLSHVVVGHLKTTSKNARQQVLERFETIVNFSGPEEPGVLRYAITVPRDATDETTIYAIEEYANQKVSDDHIASSPVQGLISMFGSQPAVLAAPPKVYQLEYTSEVHQFTRPRVSTRSHPFIVFATATQPSRGSTAELTDIWAKVVEKAQADEPNTLLYALVRDKENQSQIGTIEAYVDEAAFEEHCKSPEVEDLVARNKQIGGEMGYVALKMVTGWLSR